MKSVWNFLCLCIAELEQHEAMLGRIKWGHWDVPDSPMEFNVVNPGLVGNLILWLNG